MVRRGTNNGSSSSLNTFFWLRMMSELDVSSTGPVLAMVEHLTVFKKLIVTFGLFKRLAWVNTLEAATVTHFSLVPKSHSGIEIPHRFAQLEVLLIFFWLAFVSNIIFSGVYHP